MIISASVGTCPTPDSCHAFILIFTSVLPDRCYPGLFYANPLSKDSSAVLC